MALRIKKLSRLSKADLLFACAVTFVLMFPYLTRGFLPIEHDTFFHVSRIEQLSKAIAAGHFFPGIYPDENLGFGYTSPLFYSDFFLIIPALIHLAGVPVSICYQVTVTAASLISCLTMMNLAKNISSDRNISWIASCACLYSNYRITDIYVRGALGEIFAFAALPAVINGMYMILDKKEENGWISLCLGLSCLALCHNLTFLLGSLLCAILFFVYSGSIDKKQIVSLCKGIGFAFLLTVFYTLPMIEQVTSQKLILHYYGSASDLGSSSMKLWQYVVNNTIFGYAGNTRPADSAMTVNVGWFVTFAPLFYIFQKNKKRFVTVCLVIGYVMILMPCSIVPWDYLSFLRILQFPWRLNTLGLVLLCIPASYGICQLLQKKTAILAVIAVMSAECIWHVLPVYTRTFGMKASMSWQDVLDGELCDPCYSADYVRVELAGGDYLPWPHPDYRTQTTAITNAETGEDAGIEYTRGYAYLYFKIEDSQRQTLTLPLTWYKGWTVYKTGISTDRLESWKNDEGLVSFKTTGSGTYIAMFEDTVLRRVFMNISMLAALLFIYTAMGFAVKLPILKRK